MLRPLCFFLLAASVAVADDFPAPINTEPLSEETWMSPERAATGIQLPEGFRAVPFAAEPDVQNPIDMAWDARGRLWIAENYTYAERKQKFQLDLRDRVIILDNTCGERFKRRTVFTDDVQMLTGIEIGHGGVWLMCPPKLIFLPDRDGDDVPDSAGEVMLDGFTVAKQNYHNFANGLRFGPDGWLYGRCGGSCPGRIGRPGTTDVQRLALEGGLWRYHPQTRHVEVLTTGTTNPWGHDWNGVGEGFFTNTVNGHLWHIIPGAHFTRPFTLDPNPRTYELIDFHADHWHFDTGKSWTKSRDGQANSYGGGHAHCGAMIYQGTVWPQRYRDRLFTLNLHGRRANQERLDRDGGGYSASHEPDFFIASDPWFRGMDMSVGPDGSVFVIDWSDTGECHESTGVHRTSGRVFKIIYDQAGSSPMTPVDIRVMSDVQLASLVVSPEAWSYRQAKLELARRQTAGDNIEAAITTLRAALNDPQADARHSVQALLTLHICRATDQGFLLQQLEHANPHIRVWAIRLLTETMPIDDALGPVQLHADQNASVARLATQLMPTLKRVAASDPSSLVRLTLASTLQRIPVSQRKELAVPLGSHRKDRKDHNLPLMLWYGLMAIQDDQLDDLVQVAESCQLPTTLRLIARRLAAQVEQQPTAVNKLVAFAAKSEDAQIRSAIVSGLNEGWTGWRTVPKPADWDQLAGAQNSSETKTLLQEIGVLFGDGRSLQEVTAIALGATDASYPTRLSALATLIRAEPDDLQSICRKLLSDARMNVLAAQGLAKLDDPEVARLLVSRYGNIRAPYRPQIVSILVSRKSFARQMLTAMSQGKFPRADLSAFHIRQLQSFEDESLNQLIGEAWGEVRAPSGDSQQLIDELKSKLSATALAKGDKRNGRALFAKHCQGCHRLYGQGEQVGPDLTGGNRDNLDYLLSNLIDPSAVVDKDFRMTRILTADGRLLTGLVTAESERTITLRNSTESAVLEKDSIESRSITDQSPMPGGMLDQLTDDQIRDLIAYLRHPTQVPLAQ